MKRRLSARSARRPDFRWWISFAVIAGVAAGIAYFFDPREGRARRMRIARVPSSASRRLGQRVAAAEERWPDEPPPDVDSEIPMTAPAEMSDPNRGGRKTLLVAGRRR